MEAKTKRIWLIIAVIALVFILFGVSYAYWRLTIRQTNDNKYEAACFHVEMSLDKDEPISLENTYPLPDKRGLETEPYTFSITNTCEASASFSVSLEVLSSSTLATSKIKYSLNNSDPAVLTTKDTMDAQIENATAYVLDSGVLHANGKHDYNLKLWVDEDANLDDTQDKEFEAKIVINNTAKRPSYADNSGAESPILNNGLIPVIYDTTAKKWVKADPYKKWFDYDNQWWANAVSVNPDKREEYNAADVNTPIELTDIAFMWVWVPRYEYQTDNLGTNYAGGTQEQPGGITIHFISEDTVTPSASNFAVHDAFWWDTNNDNIKDAEEQLPGMWVAKFQISKTEECHPRWDGDIESGCDVTDVVIKNFPFSRIWVNARVGTYWTAIHDTMNQEEGFYRYGLQNSDAHMIKNSEWGAVAYLSQSKYGKWGNSNYESGEKQIFVNDDYDAWYSVVIRSGCSDGTVSSDKDSSCNHQYNVEHKGTGASTTGTIYGIYDMSGAAWEYVMGIMKESSNTEAAVGSTYNGNSGFSGKQSDGKLYYGTYEFLKKIESRYYDVYEYGTSEEDYSRYHKGDATFETAGWNGNVGKFVSEGKVFFRRSSVAGAENVDNVGIFGFDATNGSSYRNTSTRVVLVRE